MTEVVQTWFEADSEHTGCRVHTTTFDKGEVCGGCVLDAHRTKRPPGFETPPYWFRLAAPIAHPPQHTGTGVIALTDTMGCTYHPDTFDEMCPACAAEDL